MNDTPDGGATPPGVVVWPVKASAPIDKVSILGLAVAVTITLPPVALALGIAGLVRTRKGIRSGRWAAVTATAAGAATSVLIVGVISLVVWIDSVDVSIDEARRGTCVNLDEDVDGIELHEKDCTEPHDGEVVFKGDFTQNLVADYQQSSSGRFCLRAMRDLPLPDVYEPDFILGTIVDSLSLNRPSVGDAFVCILERADGDPMTAPLSYRGDA